jgi:OOP family OmpA-OmpF porin
MAAWIKGCAALGLLAIGVLVCATVDNGVAAQQSDQTEYSVFDPPVFSIELRQGRLSLDGFTSSTAHELALSQLVAEKFSTHEAVLNFRPLVLPPDSWAQITTRLLNAISTTESANAVVSEQLIEIRGITDDRPGWEHSLDTLRAETQRDVVIDADVVLISRLPPVSELCQRTFSLAGQEKVGFKQSSTEIRTSSYASLDSIISIAYDCADIAIAITGHSDASGDEGSNQRLSLARAQEVADYLVRGGLTSTRLFVTGAGSLLPVADNSTAAGRSLNRRIEFEMRTGPQIRGFPYSPGQTTRLQKQASRRAE